MNAVFDSIIVLPREPEETYGSLVVPDMGKEKNLEGTIVSIGPGHRSITGELIPTTLKAGDIVILPSMGPVKAEIDGVEYYICKETQVLAVLGNAGIIDTDNE